tara:strand:- start:93 stop:479 length:387 start_codon:yes stop_codon:yes gene_type:complete
MNKMLEYERLQYKLGNRADKPPCDKRTEHVREKLTIQQKIILQTIAQLGEATAFEVVESKGLNAYSVSAQLTHLSNANLVRKLRRVPTPDPPNGKKKKSGNADCWVYGVMDHTISAVGGRVSSNSIGG